MKRVVLTMVDDRNPCNVATRYDVPMEGACEASLACTTCHCYVEPDEMFDQVIVAFKELSGNS